MSNEIATYSMILSKLSLGKSGTECPTKTQILAINSLIVIENASTYGANECVKIDDIRKKVETWNYYLTVSPTSMSFGAGGGSKSFTVSSYKRKVLDGVEQSGDTSVSLKSTVISGSGFSLSGTTVSASANEITSNRTGTVTITQNESNKTATISLSQSGQDAYVPPADTYVFTWHDGSTSDVSANFPWDFSANGTAANIPVISTKNGSSQSWSVSSKPSWITTSTTSSKVTISASDNSGSARSGEVVLTQSGSGKTLTVNVSQEAKAADTYSWQIKKSSEPNEDAYWRQSITYDVPAKTTGFSGGWSVKGRKNGEIFAEYTMSSDSPSWLTVSGTSYTVQHNTSSSSRSGTLTLTQAESGLKCYIVINQSGCTPTYTFNVIPTNLGVTAAETNETLTVNSYKTVLESDGSETTESLDYEFSSNRDWVAAVRTTTNTIYIYVAQNSTNVQRSARITLTQEESGIQAFTNVIQAGEVQSSNKLTITSITYDTAFLFPSGEVPVEGGAVYLAFMVPNTFTWQTSTGLTINRGTIYAGELANVYVRENQRYKLVKSFQLETGEQTIII